MGLCLVFSFMFLTFSPQELPLFAAFGRIVGIFLSFRRPSAFFRTKKSQQSGLRPQIKAVPSGIRSKKCPKKLDSVPKKPVPTSVSFFLELFQKTYHSSILTFAQFPQGFFDWNENGGIYKAICERP